jgi:sugar phosphate isomerase/epimerase
MLWSGTLGRATLPDRLDAAAVNGYRGITVRADDLEQLAGAGVDIREVMRRARDRGLETVMIEANSRWYQHEPPPVPFPSDTYSLDHHLTTAAVVGARHLNLIAPFRTSASVDSLTEQFATTCDRCADAGVTVHLEFILWPPVDSLRAAWNLVRAADRSNGGIMLDTWHFCRGEPDLALLATIPGERIFSVQLSDGAPDIKESLVKDTLRHRLLPGDGVFDLAGVVRTLQAIGGMHLVGPEVLSTELNAAAPSEAARLAAEACDRVVGAVTAPVGSTAPGTHEPPARPRG